jgi:hypothetical protein
LVPVAKKRRIKSACLIMVNRPGILLRQHPRGYMVSKGGKSCLTHPYVDYYQWLCPTRKESRNHVLSLVEGLAKVDGIESVHLDYIRFPDIFFTSRFIKYNLKQEFEMPEYDFCYCDTCVAALKITP